MGAYDGVGFAAILIARVKSDSSALWSLTKSVNAGQFRGGLKVFWRSYFRVNDN